MSFFAGNAARADRIELVSRALPELVSDTAGAGSSLFVGQQIRPMVSSDGRWSVFLSAAPNLVAGQVDFNNGDDVFLYDRQNDVVTLVSRSAGAPATAGNRVSGTPSISSDGRWIAFFSHAGDLVTGQIESNPGEDVFVYDRDTGAMTLVSHIATSSVTTGNHFSFDPVISANGNAVTFVSRAGNLMTGQVDTTFNEDIFYWDRATNTTTLVTHIATSTTSAASGALSSVPVISADGAYVAYTTGATNLMSGGTDTNGRLDVYFWVRASNANFIVSHNSTQIATGNGTASSARISADGAFILFSSGGTNHVSGQSDANGGSSDMFLYSRSLGIISLVSRSNSSATITGNNSSFDGVISADGNWVAFSSRATNLVSGQSDSNGTDDLFLWSRATGVTSLVTRRAGTTTTAASTPSSGGIAGFYSINANGSAVAYVTRATDLVSGQSDTNGVADAFVFDRAAGTNALASGESGSASATANSAAGGVSLSGDGQWLAYSTAATNVLSPQVDTNGGDDVLLFGRAAAANSLVSRRDPSLPSDSIGGDSSVINSNAANPVPNAVVSADGRYTVFQSTAGRLIPGQVDVNGVADVFLYDRTTGETQLVSRASGTTLIAGNGESRVPVISADGRWVAFVSRATNLAPSQNDGNAADDVFLWDRVTGSLALVSHSSSGLIFAGTGATPALSADGSYVAFLSTATNIVPGQSDGNVSNEVFLYERATGTITMVTHSRFSTTSAQGSTGDPWISADGRYVAFASSGSSFIPSQNDPTTSNDVFLWDRTTDTFALVSHTAVSPLNAGGFFGNFTMSADGNWIAFSSSGTNLVSGVTDTNSQPDIFLWERATNTNRLVSRAAGVATTANNASQGGMLSADGSRLVFLSRATNLVSGGTDTNSGLDAFFYDRATGQVRLMSHTTASQVAAGNGVSRVVAISADGSRASFQSAASNLVALDSFGSYDILLYDPATGAVSLASYQASTSAGLFDNCDNGFLSADGKVVAFSTSDRNVVANDFNARQDVFLWINETGTDLVLGKTDGVASLVPGQPVTYLITATNAGPLPVSGALVTDAFPAALQGVTWTCAAGGGASCTAASGAGALSQSVNLPVNGTVTFAVTGTVAADATGTLANTASIAPPGAVPDLNPANNSATDTDNLTPQADLAVSLADAPDPVGRGAALTYTILVTNAGPSAAASVTVVDTLPAGTSFTGASGDGWSCGHAGGVVTCTRPSLAPGSAPALTLQATAPVARGFDTLTNTVAVSAATTDPGTGNNGAVATTSVPQPGITVAPVSGLTTTEAGGTATFTVVLDSAPLADVAISLAGSDTAEGTVSPASLTFTTGDWSTPKTVTVTGVNDDYDDGDAAFTIATGAAASTDAGYAGIDPADVAATNQDDDTAGFTVTPVDGLTTTEAGGTATFTVVATARPRADVTVALASDDTDEGTVDPASLTFTTSDWSTPKTVTVTGVDDDYDDGAASYTVTTGAAASTDAVWAGIDPADVAVSNEDDDTSGIEVSPTSGLFTTEAGGTATFTVSLAARPAHDVTISLESSDAGEGLPSPASLTFTPDDWETPRTVTVTGQDDDLRDGDAAYTIVLHPAESADAAFAGIDPADVSAVNRDDSYEGVFYTVYPCRVVDTRQPGYGPALQNNQVAIAHLHGACGIPPTARAVALNLSFSGAGQPGTVLVYPGDLAQPPVDEYLWIKAGNFSRSLSTIMQLGADGTLAILPRLKAPKLNPTVHITLDVTGYFE